MDGCLWGTHWQLGRGSDSVSSRPLRSQGQLRVTPSSLPGDSPSLFHAPTFFSPPPRSVSCTTSSNSPFTSLQTLLQARGCWQQLKERGAAPRAAGTAQQLGCQGGNLFDDFVALSRSNISILTWGHRDLCYPGAGSPSKAVLLAVLRRPGHISVVFPLGCSAGMPQQV